jgi:hypothetical protein
MTAETASAHLGFELIHVDPDLSIPSNGNDLGDSRDVIVAVVD